jgi:hypothetical protein
MHSTACTGGIFYHEQTDLVHDIHCAALYRRAALDLTNERPFGVRCGHCIAREVAKAADVLCGRSRRGKCISEKGVKDVLE